MAYFPQLVSGAVSQFPTIRQVKKRTIRMRQADGREWKAADPLCQQVEWRLELRDLTSEEWGALEALFHEAEGRRGSFRFLDPAGNLLSWSEELVREAWTRDPYLEVSTGIGDPWGRARAARLRNRAAAPQKIEQALNVPGWFQYCLSLWIRSDEGADVTIFARTGTAAGERTFRAGTGWRRVTQPVKLTSVDELVRFGVELGPGSSAEVFGMQVEAQAGASRYKKTGGRGGIYAEARFSEDVLAVKAEGPGAYSCVVRVAARV